MTKPNIVIAGGGIAGLTMGLTLHQIGVPFVILESVREMKPLGVGINIQPNAIKELGYLGFTPEDFGSAGVPAREWALVGLNGKEVYAEPRGLEAGYKWPQYAMHRGRFHIMLYDELVRRAGKGCIRLGTRVNSYEVNPDGSVSVAVANLDGTPDTVTGSLLIGADGIHSNVRACMHPGQPPIHWGGKLMWRGTVKAKPLRTESSFVGLGSHERRLVIYPIGEPDEDGLVETNFIAEITVDNSEEWDSTAWFKPVPIEQFAHYFEDMRYGWIDVPEMLRSADCAFENPMIDRDPVPTWVDGPVALMGDAAHAMYPTGSNGASQAVIDARTIGAKFLEHGVTAEALAAYDRELCKPVSELVLRNRGDGPFGLLNLLDERCGGIFDNIDEVMSPDERTEFVRDYKTAAGFAMDRLNASEPIMPADAQIDVRH